MMTLDDTTQTDTPSMNGTQTATTKSIFSSEGLMEALAEARNDATDRRSFGGRFPKRLTMDLATIELKEHLYNYAEHNGVTIGSLMSRLAYDFLISQGYNIQQKPKLQPAGIVGRPRKLDSRLVENPRESSGLVNVHKKRTRAPDALPDFGQIRGIIGSQGYGCIPVGEIRFTTASELQDLLRQSPRAGGAILQACYVDERGNLFDRDFQTWRWYSGGEGAWEGPAYEGKLLEAAVLTGKWYPPGPDSEYWDCIEHGEYYAKQLYDQYGKLHAEFASGERTLGQGQGATGGR